jgi:hypothetical protein
MTRPRIWWLGHCGGHCAPSTSTPAPPSPTSPPRSNSCAAELSFRNDIVNCPGGQQILQQDPAGNVVELFQPATR